MRAARLKESDMMEVDVAFDGAARGIDETSVFCNKGVCVVEAFKGLEFDSVLDG